MARSESIFVGTSFWGPHGVVARLDRLQLSSEFLRPPPTLRRPALQSFPDPALTFVKVCDLLRTNLAHPRMRVA